MEKKINQFTITPSNFKLYQLQQNNITFNVKNTSNRSCHYEILTPHNNHFIMKSDRSFNLAPGMTKTCKIIHNNMEQLCSSQCKQIQIVDIVGNRQHLLIHCFQQLLQNQKKIQISSELSLDKFKAKLNQQTKVQMPIKNLTDMNLKVRVRVKMALEVLERVSFIVLQEQFILLAQMQKIMKFKAKRLQQRQFTFKIDFQFVQQHFIQEWQESIIVSYKGIFNKIQYIGNQNSTKIQSIYHEVVNGTSFNACFYLVNHQDEQCPFKILQLIQINQYKHCYDKIAQTLFQIQNYQGYIDKRNKKQINYKIGLKINQNDLSFIQRYSQLNPKDQASAFKLRNSSVFRKNIQINLKVQFGNDNPITFKIAILATNPALRINRNISQKIQIYQIINDSGIQIPFKLPNSLYYLSKVCKGLLKIGTNTIQIQWKKQRCHIQQFSKQNNNQINKIPIKLELPDNQIILNQQIKIRPQTAFSQSKSRTKINTMRQIIAIKAPSKSGESGVKCFKQVTAKDYSKQPKKYIHYQLFTTQQLLLLKINQNDKGYIITNTHTNKNGLLYFPDKGYLLIQSQTSYLIPFQKKSIRFQFSKKLFVLQSKQIQDKNSYSISHKQLIFSYLYSQKQFQIVKQFQITNKSNKNISIYCLTIHDQYFHSIQDGHKLIIQPGKTNKYKLSFWPQIQTKTKQRKVTRPMQFMINNHKQIIMCQADILGSQIQVCKKKIQIKNCKFTFQEISKIINLHNKGFGKAFFKFQHSSYIRLSCKSGVISQKQLMPISIYFCPAKMPKIHSQQIKLYVKGSQLIKIYFQINTLEPDIACLQNVLDFRSGHLKQKRKGIITIVNNNQYVCNLIIKSQKLPIQCQKTVTVQANQHKIVQFSAIVEEVGQKIVNLPSNFIQLSGYGAIKSPLHYRIIGKNSILEFIPHNPCSQFKISEVQQTKKFKLKNLSQENETVKLVLTPKKKQDENYVLLSCQPNLIQIFSQQTQQFTLYAIRVDERYFQGQSKIFNYNLSIYLKGNQLYRSLDIKLQLQPPTLQIPTKVYFPITSIGVWSKSHFIIKNKGYKQVLFGIKKPVNINFQLQIQYNNTMKLSKLNKQAQISIVFKSKKPISFCVILQIQDNYKKKFYVKLFGTATTCPLLIGQKFSSSKKGFSSKELKSQSSNNILSLKSIQHNIQQQNSKFLKRWLNSTPLQYNYHLQDYKKWLKNSSNFVSLLHHLMLQSINQNTLQNIIEQLKKDGFPLYTVQIQQLLNQQQKQWNNLMWLLFSKTLFSQDCIKWINKTCAMNIQTFQSAFIHHKKIIIDLFSKIFQPVYKGKLTEWQKIIDIIQPSFPIITRIQNIKQFIVIMNLFYHKFNKVQTAKITISNFEYNLQIKRYSKNKKSIWIIANKNFEVISSQVSQQKYNIQKKIFNCQVDKQANLLLKVKDSTTFAIWNNSLSQPMNIIELIVDRKAPKTKNIIIQCEDKCSQQWKFDFTCSYESQYLFDFNGCPQFKCKMPDIGIIKPKDVLQFRVIYSPNNLKDHNAVLKISNKYQEYLYNFKGKPLRSNSIQMQKSIHIPQGQRYFQVFALPQDPNLCNQTTKFKVIELKDTTPQIKGFQVKYNKKQVIVQITFQFHLLLQNKQILLQICNKELTYCKNVRLIVHVIPKPVIIKAQIKGIVQKVTNQKIPITNLLHTRQNCFVSISRLEKQDYDKFNKNCLDLASKPIDKNDWQFKLSTVGKISLKGKQKTDITLSYMPTTLSESYCQIKIWMQSSQSIYIYNFSGIPSLPRIDNPPIKIQCDAQQKVSQKIKIFNRLKQKVSFQVQTNINFIAGDQNISIGSRQTYNYQIKLLPLHPGQYKGQLVFKNQKQSIVYPLLIQVLNKKKIRKIRIQSQVRQTSTISIDLTNKLDKKVKFQVFCNSQFILFQPSILLQALQSKPLILTYTPLFIGTQTAQLKLFNQQLTQIHYLLQMISQQHSQNVAIQCELGQKKKFKIIVQNTTNNNAKIFEPTLPQFLNFANKQQFPLSLQANSKVYIQFVYNKIKLQGTQCYPLKICTDTINNYKYQLQFQISKTKVYAPILIHYNSQQLSQVIHKQCNFQLLNIFDQPINFSIINPQFNIGRNCKIFIKQQPQITLKPYEKKNINCYIQIDGQDQNQLITLSNQQKSVIVESKEYRWLFPIDLVKVHNFDVPIQIIGSSHELIKTRVNLKYIQNMKKWLLNDFPDYKQFINTSLISSKDVYLQTVIYKILQLNCSIIFYDQNMRVAQKYPVYIKIGGKKYQKIIISANVGSTAITEIKLKHLKGKFNVTLNNNKMKQFDIQPKEGYFHQSKDNIIQFIYRPLQYNGVKKAQVIINSQAGCFNFFLIGKFPPLK